MWIEVNVVVRDNTGLIAASESSSSMILEGQERDDVIISRADEVATRVVNRLHDYSNVVELANEEKAKLVAGETQVLDKKEDK